MANNIIENEMGSYQKIVEQQKSKMSEMARQIEEMKLRFEKRSKSKSPRLNLSVDQLQRK